jgi:hypothetical protein
VRTCGGLPGPVQNLLPDRPPHYLSPHITVYRGRSVACLVYLLDSQRCSNGRHCRIPAPSWWSVNGFQPQSQHLRIFDSERLNNTG